MQNQRLYARFQFRLNQQIAVMSDGCMPSRDDFFSVPCANISRTGFAFYQQTKPTFTELVVALGVSSEPIYLTATVIFASLLEVDGKPIHRIGCQFTGRAQWSDQTQSFLRKGDIDSAFQLMSQ